MIATVQQPNKMYSHTNYRKKKLQIAETMAAKILEARKQPYDAPNLISSTAIENHSHIDVKINIQVAETEAVSILEARKQGYEALNLISSRSTENHNLVSSRSTENHSHILQVAETMAAKILEERKQGHETLDMILSKATEIRFRQPLVFIEENLEEDEIELVTDSESLNSGSTEQIKEREKHSNLSEYDFKIKTILSAFDMNKSKGVISPSHNPHASQNLCAVTEGEMEYLQKKMRAKKAMITAERMASRLLSDRLNDYDRLFNKTPVSYEKKNFSQPDEKDHMLMSKASENEEGDPILTTRSVDEVDVDPILTSRSADEAAEAAEADPILNCRSTDEIESQREKKCTADNATENFDDGAVCSIEAIRAELTAQDIQDPVGTIDKRKMMLETEGDFEANNDFGLNATSQEVTERRNDLEGNIENEKREVLEIVLEVVSGTNIGCASEQETEKSEIDNDSNIGSPEKESSENCSGTEDGEEINQNSKCSSNIQTEEGPNGKMESDLQVEVVLDIADGNESKSEILGSDTETETLTRDATEHNVPQKLERNLDTEILKPQQVSHDVLKIEKETVSNEIVINEIDDSELKLEQTVTESFSEEGLFLRNCTAQIDEDAIEIIKEDSMQSSLLGLSGIKINDMIKSRVFQGKIAGYEGIVLSNSAEGIDHPMNEKPFAMNETYFEIDPGVDTVIDSKMSDLLKASSADLEFLTDTT